MKKIPLNSIVLLIGSSKNEFYNLDFRNHEFLRIQTIKNDLIGSSVRYDISSILKDELIRRSELKLKLGERVVIDNNFFIKRNREPFIELSKKYNIPIFYVIDPMIRKPNYSDNRKLIGQNEIRDILRGDGHASVIDNLPYEISIVHKPSSNDLYSFVHNQHYNGVMAIGDVHGMSESLKSAIEWASLRNLFMIFLGDIIDYGPKPFECIDMVYDIVTRGRGVVSIGNHERKIFRWMQQFEEGNINLTLSDGNKVTTTAFENLSNDDYLKYSSRFKSLYHISRHHWILDNFMFVHGGAEPEMFDLDYEKLYGKFETIALFGEICETTDKLKMPERSYSWVDRIPKDKIVVVGHDIRNTFKPLEVKGKNGGTAIFLDTGSGKGGSLTSFDIIFTDTGVEMKNYRRF